MLHQPFHHKNSGTWTHVFACLEDQVCVVIDPVLDYDLATDSTSMTAIDEVLAFIEDNQLNLKYILETHAHADHLTGAQVLKQHLGGEVCIGVGIVDVQNNISAVVATSDFRAKGDDFDLLLSNGDVLMFGQIALKVMATPGHTPDGLSYLIEDYAVIGDTMFHPESGTARCDFPGGDVEDLYDSIVKLLSLPDETMLCLGHDYPQDRNAKATVSVAEQKAFNVHCKAPFELSLFIKVRKERDEKLASPKLIEPALTHNIKAGC